MATLLKIYPPQTAQVLDLVQQLQSHERIPVNEHQQVQAQQLQRLFAHAWHHSSFWRERLQQSGLTVNSNVMQVLAKMPMLTRQDLQTNFEASRARAPGWSDEHIATSITSGSTGLPVRVEKLAQLYAPIFAALGRLEGLWHQRDPQQKLAMLGVGLTDEAKDSWDVLSESLGLKGVCVTRCLDDRPMHTHLHWLAEVKPTYLKCSPMVAADLATLALEQKQTIQIRHIMCQSERVSPRHRELCHQAFGATIVDRYTCEESGWIALQCPEHGQLHVINPTTLLEIVDDDLQPCPPGQIGRVLLTSLHSYTMPLIRYDLGDLAEWGRCECGCTWPVIGKLWGRTRHRLQLRNGQLLAMPFLGDDIGKIPSIREFRLLQYCGGEVEIQLSAANPLTDSDRKQIEDIFVTNGLSNVDLYINQVPSIEWPIGRKREEFVRLDIPMPGAQTTSEAS